MGGKKDMFEHINIEWDLIFVSLLLLNRETAKMDLSLITRKLVFAILRPGRIQTGLLNYRDWLESGNFGYSIYRYYTWDNESV